MKKICLVTWYDSLNFGTCIQCFALSNYLESIGHEVMVPNNFSYYSLTDLSDIIRRLKKKINNKLSPDYVAISEESLSEEIRLGYKKRYSNVQNVIKNELNIIPMRGNGSFKHLNGIVDVFITGSDQIWNPNHLSSSMLLSFAKKRKIAYASSIGVSSIPETLVHTYKRYLSKFNAIGVREYDAEVELKRIIGNVPIKTVLDPTFLLNLDDYKKLALKAIIPDFIKNKKNFIFCYFIGKDITWQNSIKSFAKDYNLEIIICLSESNIVPIFGTVFAEAGPYEFVWLLNNAKYVATDSFHASAISINLNKEIIVYKRFKDTDKKSQNSRIISLLDMFELNDRLADGSTVLSETFKKQIDYHKVNEILNEQKNESIRFLVDAIR